MPRGSPSRRVLAAILASTAFAATAGTLALRSSAPAAAQSPGPSPTSASPIVQPARPSRVVVILLDRASPSIFALSTTLQGMSARGAAGLISTACAPGEDGRTPLAPSATLSAGAWARGPQPSSQPPTVQPGAPTDLTPYGTMGDLYRTRTGRSPDTPIVYPDVALMDTLNADPTVAAIPGLLGQTLEDHGILTAAVGDSDLPRERFRPAGVLAMDQAGRVSAGSFDTDRPATSGPLPVTVDLAALETATTEALATARFVVVDWGDTYRADRLTERRAGPAADRSVAGQVAAADLDAARSRSISQLDQFLGVLQPQLDLSKRDVLVIVSPTPGLEDRLKGVEAAPIIVTGAGVVHGSVTSATTRRAGMVSNTDLAPSVLSWLGVAVPHHMTGHRIEVTPDPFPLTTARLGFDRMAQADAQRTWVLSACLGLWLAAVVFAGALGVARRRELAEGRRRIEEGGAERRKRDRPGAGRRPCARSRFWARALLLGAGFLPLVLLLQPLGPLYPLPATLAEVLGGSVLLGVAWAAASGSERMLAALGAIGGLTSVAILADLAAGFPLGSRSLGGPDAAAGRSFSGLSGLFAGAAVAGTLLAAAALARRYRRHPRARWVCTGLAGLVLVALSVPTVGGSAVVALAGLPGLAVLVAASREQPPERRIVWAVAAGLSVLLVTAAVVLLGGQVALATSVPPAGAAGTAAPAALASILQAHAGRAVRLFLASGWTVGLAVSVGALVFIRIRLQLEIGEASRRAPAAGRFVPAALLSLEAAGALALLSSVTGAAAAAVTLMGATLLALGGALERLIGPR